MCLLSGLCLDLLGNIAIVDSGNNVIRLYDIIKKTVHTIVGSGSGSGSHYGEYVIALEAALNVPQGCAYDGSNNLFIADTLNNVVSN